MNTVSLPSRTLALIVGDDNGNYPRLMDEHGIKPTPLYFYTGPIYTTTKEIAQALNKKKLSSTRNHTASHF